MQEQIREILEWYGKQQDRGTQEQIVGMLRELQEAVGFLDPELQEKAARTAGVKLSVIQTIIRMYPSLKEADYRHVILACSGERCGAKQGGEVLRALRQELGISGNGLSADGKVLLKTQNCLKQCRTSPNLMIDGVLHTKVTPEQAILLARGCCQD